MVVPNLLNGIRWLVASRKNTIVPAGATMAGTLSRLGQAARLAAVLTVIY